MKKYIVEPEYSGYEIGNYLKEVHNYSGRGLRKLDIYLNGTKVKNNSKKIKKLNRITIIEKDLETGIIPIDIPLNIVFEDNNLLIINKDSNLVVHPTKKKVDVTLANGVVNYLKNKTGKLMVPRFFNRLDMNTTGLIVVTKDANSQTFLQNKGEVKKYYKAIVEGIIKEDELLIETPIGRVGDSLRRVELPVSKGGQEAKTAVTVLERFKAKDMTLIKVELLTGRTHQIRAHLSLNGNPLLGDRLYGGRDDLVMRQMLHAYKLKFIHPITLKEIELEIDIPLDMSEILKIL